MNHRFQPEPISSAVPKAQGSEPVWWLKTELLSTVKATPVQWVCRAPDGKGLLPAGLSIIVADPGIGKSTLVRAIMASMTTGAGHFQTEPGEVLVLIWEDCESSLILPNLLAAGGDPRKVHLLRGIESDIGTDGAWHPQQLGLIREFLEKHPDTRMIVVDVLASLSALGGRNSDRGEDVRGLLDPLHKLGLELGVAVCVLHHQNKRVGESAMTRVSGSVQISGTSRLVWAVGIDPDDPEIRRVACVKSNIPGRCEHGFAFKEVATDRGQTEAWAKSCGVNLPPELEDDVFRRLEIVTGLAQRPTIWPRGPANRARNWHRIRLRLGYGHT